MKILLLGGEYHLNRPWIEDISASISALFDETIMQYFKHWELGEDGKIDLEFEIKSNQEIGKKLEGEDYVLFAKSAGSIVSLRNIYLGKLKPQKIIFIGFPYNYGIEKGMDIDCQLGQLNIPTTFIQKEYDNVGGLKELKKIVERNCPKPHQIVKYEVDGEPDDNHHYANIEYIKELIEKCLL